MNRILVLGSSGSGKSTFAQQFGNQLEIEIIHLDTHYWQPDWTETSPDKWVQTLENLLKKDRWIMDGNYPASLAMRLNYADTVIFLDHNRWTCLWRCLKRYLKFRGQNRPELSSGCNEKIDRDFLQWIWRYPQDVKPSVLEMVNYHPDVELIILKGSKQVKRFLNKWNTR